MTERRASVDRDRPCILISEDCVEFRMFAVACGEQTLDPWFEQFLEPERITPKRFTAALHERGRPFDVHFDLVSNGSDPEAVDGLLVERRSVTGQMLDRMPRLRHIVKFGRDTINIDLAACEARGITVATVPRRTTANVADHTVMLMLAVCRKLLHEETIEAMREPPEVPVASTEEGEHPPTVFNWAGLAGIKPLSDVRLVVIGPGEIGQEVLHRARGFGMELGYWGRRRVAAIEEELSAVALDRYDVPDWADVVSLHIPYSDEVHHLVDAEFLRRLGPDGVVVNTARGLLIDHDALLDALWNRTIAGAGLDVFPEEPLPENHPLTSAPNVVLTPHVGGGSRWDLVEDVASIVSAFDLLKAPL